MIKLKRFGGIGKAEEAQPAPQRRREISLRKALPFEAMKPEERNGLLRLKLAPLTGDENAKIPVVANLRSQVCLLPNGTLVAGTQQAGHQIVAQVAESAAKIGVNIVAYRTASLEDIKLLVTAGTARSFEDDVELVPMQKEILQLFADALAADATDVKVSTGPHSGEVMFCINDSWYKVYEWDPEYTRRWLASSFNLCQAPDGVYREGQQQKARLSSTSVPLPGNIESIRMQFLPLARGGRALVARLLKARTLGTKRTMESLGYDAEHIALMRVIRSNPSGVILMCGPTGSGKSTTLVVSMEALYEENNGKNHILTIEDPAEYEIRCATQTEATNANTEQEKTAAFGELFNAALRAKPHVIMVGEVRGRAAGKMLIEASMTGHQCWSTIHASGALTVPSRLNEMGIDRYLVRDPTIITGVIFQRLLPTLCQDCALPLRAEQRFSPTMKAFLEGVTPDYGALRFHNPSGCDACRRGRSAQVGYSGQTVCAEVLIPSGPILDLCLDGERHRAERIWLSEPGILTAFEHAVRKMNVGLIDPEDVFRKLYDKHGLERLVENPTRLMSVVTGRWPRPQARGGHAPHIREAEPPASSVAAE